MSYVCFIRRFHFILTCALLVLGAPAPRATAAPPPQSLDAIREVVLAHLRSGMGAAGDVEIRLEGPAPDLRLPACAAPLQARDQGVAALSGPRTVEVSCPGQPGWTLYVPVRLRARAVAVVAGRALAAGQLLRAEDLRAVAAEQASLPPSALTRPEEAVGRVLRYAVAAGQPIVVSMLTGPELVRAGQPVALVAQGAGVRLVASAVAMENGRQGQSILARNTQSGRVVSGVVGANGDIVIQVTP